MSVEIIPAAARDISGHNTHTWVSARRRYMQRCSDHLTAGEVNQYYDIISEDLFPLILQASNIKKKADEKKLSFVVAIFFLLVVFFIVIAHMLYYNHLGEVRTKEGSHKETRWQIQMQLGVQCEL